MSNILLGLFLVAHGVIHLGYVTPTPPDPKYPFSFSKSWLVTRLGLGEPLVRPIGVILCALVVLGFALTGLAAFGILVPQSWGLTLAVASSALSLLVLVLFFHPWLILGIGIDAALLVAMLWGGWQPFCTVAP